MRNEIALLLFLLGQPMVGLGEELPDEAAMKLVQKFDNVLCKDSAFTECLGLEKKRCEEHLPLVLVGCDYSPLWKEIRRRDKDHTNKDRLTVESRKYGECVNNRFQRQCSVDPTVFEQCLQQRFERYVESVSTHARSSRP